MASLIQAPESPQSCKVSTDTPLYWWGFPEKGQLVGRQIGPVCLGLGLPGRPFIPGLRVLKAGACWAQTAGVGDRRPHEDPRGQRQEAKTCGGKNPRFAMSTPASAVYSLRGRGACYTSLTFFPSLQNGFHFPGE